MATIENIKTLALQVKNETVENNNTAERVGNVLNEITDFIKDYTLQKSVNLFNKETAIEGYYTAYDTGLPVVNAEYATSDFIEVLASTSYMLSGHGAVNQVAWYDKNKKFISGTATAFPNISPDNAMYVKINTLFSNIDTAKFEEGTTATSYTDFVAAQTKNSDLTESAKLGITRYVSQNLPDQSILANKLNFVIQGKNRFDKSTITPGKYISPEGVIYNSALFSLSDYIPVLPGEELNISHQHYYSLFDQNLNWMSGGGINPTEYDQIIIPGAEEVWLRLTILNEHVDVLKVETDDNTAFEPFQIRIPALNAGLGIKWRGKKWASMGDSITASGSYQKKVIGYLGLDHTNCGISGTAVAGTGENAFHQDTRIEAIPEDANIVTILGGTNDYAQDVPLGLITDSSTGTFYGAYNTVIAKLLNQNPLYRIILMSTPYGEYDFGDGFVNAEGLTTKDYAEAVRLLAKRWGLPLIDIDGECGWNTLNMSDFLVDEFHPNALGYNRMSEVIVGKLQTLQILD